MPKTMTAKPRLKNLDDLLLSNDGVNPLEQPAETPFKRMVSTISVEQLKPFPEHPFRLYEGERLDDMVESIRANGVLVPILVRQNGNTLEILSGHNRVNAARIAGLEIVPAIILSGISDAEAWVYIIETNLMQRSFSEMSHSEKAAVIASHHSKLFSQGKRNDIIRELELLEKPHEHRENGTVCLVGEKLHTGERVAEMYGLSSRTVARYQRVHQLIPALKTRFDKDDIAFFSAVSLSYLKEAEQSILDDCLKQGEFLIDMKKADALRHHSEKGKLNGENIIAILNGQTGQKPPPARTPSVKVNKDVYAKYFKPSQSAKEVQGIVEKALELYFNQ